MRPGARLSGGSVVLNWLAAGCGAVCFGLTCAPAFAKDSVKTQIKHGCEAVGNSFVENASDNTFVCNIRTGGQIKCTDTKEPRCTYSQRISREMVSSVLKNGGLKMVP
jgi:hypothetical protein